MGRYWTTLDVRVIDDSGPRPYMYLLEPFQFESEIVGVITIPAGFGFDGASIPQECMSFTGWPGIRAACVHDWLVSTTVDRRVADRVFREALEASQVNDQVADLMYSAVAGYTRVMT